jgi:4,5-dihydroxyphthalate decarboxylase
MLLAILGVEGHIDSGAAWRSDPSRGSDGGDELEESRRRFLKIGALAGAALAGSARLADATGAPQAAKKATRDGLRIKMAGYNFDRVSALVDGRVPVDGCTLEFEVAKIGDMNTDVFSGTQSRDVTEIGLSPFMLAYANEGFRSYTLIPVFPLRLFRHKSIFIRAGSGIAKPQDLRGRRVATPGYSSTSLTWLRGIVQHEYGVAPEEIEWVISSKDSSAADAGKASKQESIVPEGISVAHGPAGKDESDLLVDGDVDALFHAAEPQAFTAGNPAVKRLFPDSRSTEQEYFAKTGIFPIMHAVAIRTATIEQHPWLPEAVFFAYSRAKQLNYANMRKSGWFNVSLPWFAQEFDDTRDRMGENFWPYGIEPNRKALEALFRYSHEQGLARKRLTVEELFHPSTMKLEESA